MHLRRVALHGGAARMQRGLDYDPLRRPCGDQVERLAHHFFHVHRDPLRRSGAAEREHAIHQRAAALPRGKHALEVSTQTAARGSVPQCPLAEPQDRREDVVEIVRDAAGEGAHRLESLRLPKARFHSPQLLLRMAPLGPVRGFTQRAAHRGRDPCQPVLDDVVGCTSLERFDRHLLAQRSGDEYERHVGTSLAGELECRQPIEGGKREIGEDQIEAACRERGFEIVPGVDPRCLTGDAVVLEQGANQLGVVAVVLEVQNAQRRIHGWVSAPRRSQLFFRTLPGGGSLMTAQKTPSSLMALTNSWKSTGLTT